MADKVRRLCGSSTRFADLKQRAARCYALFVPDRILSPEQFEELLPLAAAWAEEQEAKIIANGVALTAEQMDDAREVGVAHPGRVRILAVDTFPAPEHPALRAAGEAVQLISPATRGLTLGYGILIRRDVLCERWLVVHELAHTAQYERLGGALPFLRQYLHECLTVGYPASPLEQEAVRAAARRVARH
jgi:hypothetical protein